MPQHLSRETLNQILQAETIESLSLDDLTRLVLAEPGMADFAPDGLCQVDPRNGDRIVYNSARARRPHDNRPDESATNTSPTPCVICQGKTTGVIDVADLSEGFTFINKNLYPVLYPAESFSVSPVDDPGPAGTSAVGFHFLQWTSSLHHKDWHNMPQTDRAVVLQRLAALKQKLLTKQPAGYVSIFKNYGRLVGGSLAHGHQQIGFSNIMPRRVGDNQHFEQERGEPFSAYMLRENPAEFILKNYGPAVLLIPYFMRRPFDMLLLLKDTGRRHNTNLPRLKLRLWPMAGTMLSG